MSKFTLNKELFNPALYKQVQNIWFQGQPLSSEELNPAVLRRWFMGSPEEKMEFDGICRNKFADALEAIGPENFPNPTAEPFIQELNDIKASNPTGDGSETAWAALSILLLLDQMTRNIFRTNDGLVRVYSHYDKISYALMIHLLASNSPIARPDLHPQWRKVYAYRQWFYLPLMHSEDIGAHEKADEIMLDFKKEVEDEEGYEGSKKFLYAAFKAEKEHRDVLNRFGRYPHRNVALGRKSTSEEEEFLAGGGATFGVSQDKE